MSPTQQYRDGDESYFLPIGGISKNIYVTHRPFEKAISLGFIHLFVPRLRISGFDL